MNNSTCDILDGKNQKQCYDAIEFVKRNKKIFIDKFASPNVYPLENNPISVFMAGSPGAGKTEFSKRLIAELKLKGVMQKDPVRIDSDDVRGILPGYTGDNSFIFQPASAIGVEKLYDHVLKKRQSAIIDGTFSTEKSLQNIQRSIDKSRPVEIFYIYQEPKLAWEFTKKREALEKRNIPRNSFIDSFLASKENVNKAKVMFGDRVRLNLVIKDFEKGFEELKLDIQKVDSYLQISYTKDELEKMII
jgi:UDP-N-acetylglucosamine kinase